MRGLLPRPLLPTVLRGHRSASRRSRRRPAFARAPNPFARRSARPVRPDQEWGPPVSLRASLPEDPTPRPLDGPFRPPAANDDRPGAPARATAPAGSPLDHLLDHPLVAAAPLGLVVLGLGLSPVAASGLTVAVLTAAFVALVLRATGRLPAMTGAERAVSWLCVAYVALGFAVSLGAADPWSGAHDAFPDLGLLALPLLLPALRAAAATTPAWPRAIATALVAGSVLALPLAVGEIWLTGNARPELASGNSLMLSQGAGLAGALCVALLVTRPPIARAWLVLGALAAAGPLVAAGGRGPIVAFAALAVVALPLAPRGARRAALALVVGLVALGASGTTANDTLASRFRLAAAQADAGMERIVEESMHARAVLMDGALRAWRDAPWLGHGRQHVMAAIQARGAPHPSAYGHGHPHNAALNEAVAGGVALLALYLALLVSPLLIARGGSARALAAAGVGWLALTGLTNIGFGHDVTIGGFIALAALAGAWPRDAPRSARSRGRRARPGRVGPVANARDLRPAA